MPNLSLVTAPTTEPLTVQEVKDHLRILDSDEDSLLYTYITAARQFVENQTRRALITQTWDLKLDEFPKFDEVIELPKSPIQSVTSITYTDENGDSQTLSTAIEDLTSIPARLTPAYQLDWPTTRDIINAVTIRYVAGYGDSASDVPMALRHAIKLCIGHLYENRETSTTLSLSEVPLAFNALIAPYIVRTFY